MTIIKTALEFHFDNLLSLRVDDAIDTIVAFATSTYPQLLLVKQFDPDNPVERVLYAVEGFDPDNAAEYNPPDEEE